ncbi:MAG TPA: hypothetical protein DDZ84_02830 [Firmicutes bacterium]|nr:hypothetical protein [Bacillota bacterium]
MRTKSADLEALASRLDISPTMHRIAVDHYDSISRYLHTRGISADFYPQGSFRLGTVVRPLRNNVEADFDIDVVCELEDTKEETTPEDVKESVGKALAESGVYGERLRPEEDRCWTLEFANVSDGIGLNMDVVPCVHEDKERINVLVLRGVSDGYAQSAVAITEKNGIDYRWQASNPKGYGDWFDSINRRFLEVGLEERKATFLSENRAMFAAEATIEDVPDYFIKSPLQRVIQLLKRHRDIYYIRADEDGSNRVASVIIATLAAKIAQDARATQTDELLGYVVRGMSDYSSLLQGRVPAARAMGEARDYIEKQDQKWRIPNPVNPDDNYADTWTDRTAQLFFQWVSALSADLAIPTPLNEPQYFTSLKSGLGTDFVTRTLAIPTGPAVLHSTPKSISQPTKPWR